MAIICACLPVCRLPLAYLFPKYFAISRREQRTGPEGDIGHREISSQSALKSWQSPHQHDVAIEAGVGPGPEVNIEMDRKYNPTASGRRPSASGSVSSDVDRKMSTDGGGMGVTVYQRDRISTDDDKMMGRDTNSEDSILHVSSLSATRSRSNSRLGVGKGRDRSGDGIHHVGVEARPGGGIQMTTQFSITYDER